MRNWQVLVTAMALLIGASPMRAQPYRFGPEVVMGALEDRDRVLAVALHPEYWAAYDLDRGSLYRVWKGSLDAGGSPTHPGSAAVRGQVLQRDTEDEVWRLRIAGRDTTTTFTYLGFRKEIDHVVLSYALSMGDGSRILVDETSQLTVSETGDPEMRRRFVVIEVPADVEVLHRVTATHLPSLDAVHYPGRLQRSLGKRHRHVWGETYDMQGWIVLPEEGQTDVLVTRYDPDGIRQVTRDDAADVSDNPYWMPVTLRSVGPNNSVPGLGRSPVPVDSVAGHRSLDDSEIDPRHDPGHDSLPIPPRDSTEVSPIDERMSKLIVPSGMHPAYRAGPVSGAYQSVAGDQLWASEAWYTLQAQPTAPLGRR